MMHELGLEILGRISVYGPLGKRAFIFVGEGDVKPYLPTSTKF